MTLSSSGLVVSAGIFDFALALFHCTFWRLFRWPESLGSLGNVNRKILYILNLAVLALFVLAGTLLVTCTADVLGTRLGFTLLWGLSLFWFLRAVLQPVMFGLGRPLSIALFLVFLLGAGLHGLAAMTSGSS
jgi:hypothetical protein